MNPQFQDFEPDMGETTLRKILANYYGMVENLDWNIGRVVQCLEDKGILDSTLIVYISDHGDYVGSHGLRTTKITHHEESISIPSIFHLPKSIPAQGNVDGLFSLVDLMATTLGLVNIDIPVWNQGTDFSPAILGQDFDGPEEVLLEMVNNPRWDPRFVDWRGLVTDRYKYAFYEDGSQVLHDLKEDPYEMNDISETQPEIRDNLKQRLLEVLAETREPFFDVLIQHGVTPEETKYIDTRERKRKGILYMGGLVNENNGTGGLK
jgi:arylsulfatase A-like enzyme